MSFYIGYGQFDPAIFSSITGFRIEISPPESVPFSFLETVDGRLSRAGTLLRQTGKKITLLSPDHTEIYDRASRRKITKPADAANPNLEEKLGRLIGVRYLHELLSGQMEILRINFTAELGKTVCRAEVNQYTPDRFESFFTIDLRSLTGYQNEYQIPEQKLSDALSGPASPADIFRRLNIAETFQGYYTRSAPDKNLQAGEAMRHILQDYLKIILKNRDDILKSTEPESLHDFRVYLRRSRTLLSQFSSRLPAENILLARENLSTLFRQTNSLRDLDVYLLSESEYRRMLPEKLQPGIAPLFRRLRLQQKRELNRVREWLVQTESVQRLSEWQNFIIHDLKFSDEPAKTSELLSEVLEKRFRRLIRKGKRMQPQTDTDSIHAVRIEAKKLRYFIEAFQNYFEAAGTTELLKRLRKMQTSFGNFNDLTIQSRFIQAIIEQAGNERKPDLNFMAAAGALAGIFHLRLSQSRDLLITDFTRFDTAETRSIVSILTGRAGTWP